MASHPLVLKSGLKDEEVEAFRRDVLQIISSNEGERKYLAGVSQYLRVPTIEKHEAIALTFQENITKAEREEVMRRVKSSPIVFRVYEDIAPADIKLSQ